MNSHTCRPAGTLGSCVTLLQAPPVVPFPVQGTVVSELSRARNNEASDDSRLSSFTVSVGSVTSAAVGSVLATVVLVGLSCVLNSSVGVVGVAELASSVGVGSKPSSMVGEGCISGVGSSDSVSSTELSELLVSTTETSASGVDVRPSASIIAVRINEGVKEGVNVNCSMSLPSDVVGEAASWAVILVENVLSAARQEQISNVESNAPSIDMRKRVRFVMFLCPILYSAHLN